MLVPAILYKEEIVKSMQEYFYTTDMLYETGSIANWTPEIVDCPSESQFQYAIVDKNKKLVGFLGYWVDWYVSKAYNFGLFSFDRGNPTIGIDVLRELNYLIKKCRVHRIEYNMISGNSVENHYDKFCYHYGGKKIFLTDVLKDREGNYHNCVIYEIIFYNN